MIEILQRKIGGGVFFSLTIIFSFSKTIKRRATTYAILISEILWAAIRLLVGADNENQLETLISCSVVLVVMKFSPRRIYELLVSGIQIYATYNVQNYLEMF